MDNRNYLLISMLLCACGICAHAHSYNHESEVGHEYYKSDDGAQRAITKIGIKYFPTEIKFDNKSPFTELAFIQRKNSYSVSLANMQYQDSNFATTHTPVIGFGILANDSNISLGINYNQSDKKSPLKVNQNQYYDLRNKSYEINYGWYALEKTLLGLSVGKKINSYSAGDGLTSVNDLQRSSNGLFSHSVIDFYNDQQLVLDLSFKWDKSQLQNQSTAKNQTKDIKVKYFPVTDFYILGGAVKSVGTDNLYAGNSKIFGLGYAPRRNLNFLFSKEAFTIYNSNQGASNSSAYASIIYKY
jgi:hypothetical protein